jgi:hypothetical protein
LGEAALFPQASSGSAADGMLGFAPRQRCGGGQPGQPRELDVCAVGVGLQHGEQLDVNVIKLNSQVTN